MITLTRPRPAKAAGTHILREPADQFYGDDGAFLVAYVDDVPVACGGIKRLDDETAEVKPIYVVPEARSRGLGRSILTILEDEARRLGYRRARLDTGPRQPHARRLCKSTGNVAILAYNDNPLADFWAEKRL